MANAVVNRPFLTETIRQVTEARDAYLARLPTSHIAAAIDQVIELWLDPSYPPRRRAEVELPQITGYSSEMVRVGLPLLLQPFRKAGLDALLRQEFGDGCVPEGGPRVITHILAGNIPSIGPESMIRALLVRSASLVKASSGDPLFPALFQASLAEVDARLAASVAVLHWQGGEREVEEAAAGASDAIIVYGGDDAIEHWRRLTPPGVSFVEHGRRISFALIGREALTGASLHDLAEKAAWDVAFFDQQGCVSPHTIFAEAGGQESPIDFAAALAQALHALQLRLPRGRPTTAGTAAIQQARATWELRQAAGQPVALFQSPASTAWTVLYEEGSSLEATCLNRTVRVVSTSSPEEAISGIAPLRRYLQTAGMAVSPKRLATLAPVLVDAGVTRVCELGQMQHPPADWLHDGRHPLRELMPHA